jgi:fused signal recognition particle receptor
MELVYVLIALIVLVGAYFLFFKRSEAPELPPAPNQRPLSERPKRERPSGEPKVKAPGKDSSAPPLDRKIRKSAPPAEPPQNLEATREEHERDLPPSSVAGPSAPQQRPLSAAPPAPSALEKLRKGLSRSRSSEGFFGRLRALFRGRTELNAELASAIEEVLLTSDVGVETTKVLLDRVREELRQSENGDPEKAWDALASEARTLLDVGGNAGGIEITAKPTVVLMVGVNGAGKTTTIGKLATKLQGNGHRCVLAAGDTFRAAAVQQLVVWGERIGCEVVRGKDGADPGSVVFDAIKRAQEIGADVVLADTAGRLHTKSNLMAEMKKIAKTAEKALAGAPHETLLVIDATNGQNALAQAREFSDALPLSGIVLTKLDGTAKGGVVLGIAHTLKLPVRFIGLGERPDDLHEFRAVEFVEALLGREAGASAN